MNCDAKDLPVACTLSAGDLREREATILAQFRDAVTGMEELPDGYAFRLPGDRNCVTTVATLIAAERECCPFLKFEMVAHPNHGSLIVRISGPVGTKEFLRAVLRKPEASS